MDDQPPADVGPVDIPPSVLDDKKLLLTVIGGSVLAMACIAYGIFGPRVPFTAPPSPILTPTPSVIVISETPAPPTRLPTRFPSRTPTRPPTPTPTASASRTVALSRADSMLTGNFSSETVRPAGKTLWKIHPGKFGATTPPIVAHGQVYFGTGDKTLFAVDARTGRVSWQLALPLSTLTPITIAGSRLYASCYDGKVYAIDVNTKNILWNYAVENAKNGRPGYGSGMILSATVVANDIVYFSDNNGRLYAVDANTGSLKWKFETQFSYIIPTVAVKDNVVYVTNNEGYLHALDAQTGTEKWRYSLGARQTITSPVISGNRAYFVTKDGYLHAVDIASGQPVWAYQYKQDSCQSIGVFPQSVGVYGDQIYLSGTCDSVLEVVGFGGQLLHTFTAGEWVESPASFASGLLFLGSYARAQGNAGFLYAVDPQTLQLVWKYSPDAQVGIVTPPVIADGIIYFRAEDGTIYAVE
jgi:eukaryotic-like serine/threonine-protein kinase